MEPIAIRSNDLDECKSLISKLEELNLVKAGTMKPEQLIYQFYLTDKDIIVSPLCLEMHYPEYKEVHGSEFLKNY